ncbi:hypothetical protein BXU10_13665 [Flavobacterium sp. LM4]|nr:hypothetical protein BXU10_13665 [Flavobacterium sp. LM4]
MQWKGWTKFLLWNKSFKIIVTRKKCAFYLRIFYKNIKVYFDYLPLENHGMILHPAVSNSF